MTEFNLRSGSIFGEYDIKELTRGTSCPLAIIGANSFPEKPWHGDDYDDDDDGDSDYYDDSDDGGSDDFGDSDDGDSDYGELMSRCSLPISEINV